MVVILINFIELHYMLKVLIHILLVKRLHYNVHFIYIH